MKNNQKTDTVTGAVWRRADSIWILEVDIGQSRPPYYAHMEPIVPELDSPPRRRLDVLTRCALAILAVTAGLWVARLVWR